MLELCRRRPGYTHVQIAPAPAVLARRILVAQVEAAGEADRAVDHQDLLVVAAIEAPVAAPRRDARLAAR